MAECRGAKQGDCRVSRSRVGPASPQAGWPDRKPDMSKQEMRDEAERLVKEAMERKNLSIKQGNTRIEAVCGKCGAPNRVTAAPGQTRVSYKCKECGDAQRTL